MHHADISLYMLGSIEQLIRAQMRDIPLCLSNLDPEGSEGGWLALVLRPARQSIRVVFPAPEEPTRAVRTPGRKAPEQLRSSWSISLPSHVPNRFIESLSFTKSWKYHKYFC